MPEYGMGRSPSQQHSSLTSTSFNPFLNISNHNNTMHAATFILALSSLVGYGLASSGKCHGQRLYCGHSLKNMGKSRAINISHCRALPLQND